MISLAVSKYFSLVAASALSLGILSAQSSRPPGGGGTSAGGGGNTGTNTPGTGSGNVGNNTGRTTNPFPGQRPNEQQFPTFQRPIFLQGKVMMDDGVPPPESVMIERVCGGVVKHEAYTDGKGRFSFELGRNNQMFADASTSGPTDIMSSQSASTISGGRPVTERELMGCELRAALPGYRSDIVNLAGRRTMDNPDVGVIILHRMDNVQGFTVSATSALAPKDAKKAYDKALDQIKKNKWSDARTNLEKAVAGYPKYAAAWFELGRTWEAENNIDEARKAYGESLNADSRFLKPYLPLAGLSMREKKWQDVVSMTDKLIKLDPFDYPGAYLYNAIGNLNLQKLDEAEKSAREAVRLDPNHVIPKASHVLGVILANKGDWAGAAASMKTYLELQPNAGDSEFVRKQLSEVEKSLAAKAGTSAAPQQ